MAQLGTVSLGLAGYKIELRFISDRAGIFVINNPSNPVVDKRSVNDGGAVSAIG